MRGVAGTVLVLLMVLGGCGRDSHVPSGHSCGSRPFANPSSTSSSAKVDGLVLGRSPADDVSVAEAHFNLPEDAIESADGIIYVAETQAHVIKRIRDGVVSVFAGTFEPGFNGDGDRSTTQLNGPMGLVFTKDERGIFFADSGNFLIRHVDVTTGRVTTIAGRPDDHAMPSDGSVAEDGPVGFVSSLRRDDRGNLWFPTYRWDARYTPVAAGIFRVDADGVVHEVRLPRQRGPVEQIRDVYVGKDHLDFIRGEELVRLFGNGVVRRTRLTSSYGKGMAGVSTSSTLVGSHDALLSVDHRLRTRTAVAGFVNISNVQRARRGYLVTDSDAGVLYRFDHGVKKQLTGFSKGGYGALVSVAKYTPTSVLVLDNQKPRIFELDLRTGQTRRWAGTGTQAWATLGADRLRTSFYHPVALAVDHDRDVFVLEQGRILKISGTDCTVGLLAGSKRGGDRDGYWWWARFNSPSALSVDVSGNLIVADTYNNKVRKVTAHGFVSTIAGTGAVGDARFGVSAVRSPLNRPSGVLALHDHRILVADSWNNAVYALGPGGVLRPFAGRPRQRDYQGQGTFSGDGHAATRAGLNTPVGLAEDGRGTVYIGDMFNNRIRKVTASGRITTLAGESQGFAPEGRLLNLPTGLLAVDESLLVADAGNRIVVRYWLERPDAVLSR